MSEELPLVNIKGVPRRYVGVTVNEYIHTEAKIRARSIWSSISSSTFVFVYFLASIIVMSK